MRPLRRPGDTPLPDVHGEIHRSSGGSGAASLAAYIKLAARTRGDDRELARILRFYHDEEREDVAWFGGALAALVCGFCGAPWFDRRVHPVVTHELGRLFRVLYGPLSDEALRLVPEAAATCPDDDLYADVVPWTRLEASMLPWLTGATWFVGHGGLLWGSPTLRDALTEWRIAGLLEEARADVRARPACAWAWYPPRPWVALLADLAYPPPAPAAPVTLPPSTSYDDILAAAPPCIAPHLHALAARGTRMGYNTRRWVWPALLSAAAAAGLPLEPLWGLLDYDARTRAEFAEWIAEPAPSGAPKYATYNVGCGTCESCPWPAATRSAACAAAMGLERAPRAPVRRLLLKLEK